MDYFVSWTHSDPIYQMHIPNVRVLVSPPNVNLVWNIVQWDIPPVELIIDSGAFQYHKEQRHPTPQWVLERQLRMVHGATVPVGICHLDTPMLGTRVVAELERRVVQNLHNAQWLITHIDQNPLPANVRPIAVIQGYSAENVYTVAQELADMGYTSFALGSLAGLVASKRDELYRRVEAALEAVGSKLHVLGVSSVEVLTRLARLGIDSADSGAPAHEAWRGGLFYSRPFRRFKVASPHFREWSRSYSFSDVLEKPLPCQCPTCEQYPQLLMEPRGKTFVNMRAVHNCFHLMRELELSNSM